MVNLVTTNDTFFFLIVAGLFWRADKFLKAEKVLGEFSQKGTPFGDIFFSCFSLEKELKKSLFQNFWNFLRAKSSSDE